MSVPPRSRLRAAALVAGALVLPVALALAGCAGGSSAGSTAESAVDRASGEAPAVGGESGLADGTSGGTAPQPADGKAASTVVTPKLVRTATVSLVVTDVSRAAAQVRSLAAGVDGMVVNESVGTEKPMPVEDGTATPPTTDSSGVLVLSVPAAALDRTLAELAKVGTVSSRTTTSTDVTAEYVDAESRLATMRASVTRVRALMTQATSIAQVVTLESELSRREADLESLEAQLAALKGNVERSTVTVYLGTSAQAPEEPNGFLAGLASGWDAFLGSGKALMTVIGAVLPFALFGALVGVPLVLWVRRRMAAGQPVLPAVTPSPAPDAPAAP